jgi:hypothetical protein
VPEPLASPVALRTESPFTFDDKRLGVLWGHWMAALRMNRRPRRADIDPAALRGVLPMIWIYRVDGTGRDFYCSLAGEEIVAAWNLPGLIGLHMSKMFEPEVYPELRERWLHLLDSPAVMHSSTRYQADWAEPPRRRRRAERLTLPLWDAEEAPYGVLGMTSYVSGTLDRDPTTIGPLPPRIVPVDALLGS